jgi:chromosome segregation ATPase
MNYIKAKLCPKQERMKHELSRLTEVETSLKTDLAEQYIRAADYEADIEELQNFKIDFDKLASENQKTIKSLADEVQKVETLRRKLEDKNNSEEHLIYEVSEKLNIIKALRVELASKSQVIL